MKKLKSETIQVISDVRIEYDTEEAREDAVKEACRLHKDTLSVGVSGMYSTKLIKSKLEHRTTISGE